MARQPKPIAELSPSYAARLLRGFSRGFDRRQSRGHAGKDQVSVTTAKDTAKRFEIPIENAAKIKPTETVQKFDQQKTLRLTQTVGAFDPAKLAEHMRNPGPGYVGTSVRVRLKNGKHYQTRTFGSPGLGAGMVAGLGEKYGFTDDDIEDVEFFDTYDIAA